MAMMGKRSESVTGAAAFVGAAAMISLSVIGFQTLKISRTEATADGIASKTIETSSSPVAAISEIFLQSRLHSDPAVGERLRERGIILVDLWLSDETSFGNGTRDPHLLAQEILNGCKQRPESLSTVIVFATSLALMNNPSPFYSILGRELTQGATELLVPPHSLAP